MQSRRNSRSGYTLLELLVAVSIVATLATIGIQQYGLYIAKSLRPEAQLSMSALWEAQKHHFQEHGEYAASFMSLNFNLRDGELISPTEYRGENYTFQLSRPNGPESWYCMATGNIDGDAWLDVLVTGDF